jgi:hypothetical protein
LIFAATLKAIGLKIEPHAPPKDVYLFGPTAGYGSMLASGSIKENIVLVALTPFPPALRVEAVICSVIVELGDSFTKTGFLNMEVTHLTIFSTTYGTSEQARPIPLSGIP